MHFLEGFEKKVFRDTVHGYIDIPTIIVKYFIDTEVFQRLRSVEQTGMRVLFPSARHDRFIHSLGTYHIGKKAYRAFKENIMRHYEEHYILDDSINDYIWGKYEALFLIACLLHDCGHSPFSHAFEYLLDEVHLNAIILDEYVRDEFKNDFFIGDNGSDGNRTVSPNPHELLSAIFVNKYYRDNIKNVMQDLFGDKHKTDEEDEDIEFIARAIIGCKYSDLMDKKKQIKNCLIQLLNSKSIDVDGLDYIIRDSELSGVDNVAIDVDRLINSLTVVETRKYSDIYLDDNYINAIILDGCLQVGSLKGQIAGMLDVNDYNGSLSVCDFNGAIKNRLNVKGRGRIVSDLNFDGNIRIGSAYYENEMSPPKNIVDFEVNTLASSDMALKDASFFCDADTNMEIVMDDHCSSIVFKNIYIKGNLTGTFSGTTLGDDMDCGSCDVKQIELAFHKSSLSVLHNVVYARNYEYLWIYAHHKVAYYANYLLIELLYITADLIREEQSGLPRDEIVRKILAMYGEKQEIQDHLYCLSNDNDILGLYKEYYLKVKEKIVEEPDSLLLDKAKKLYQELFRRQYKRSAWKSFAEFKMFFSDLTERQLLNLKDKLLNQNISDVSCNYNYGYLKGHWKEKFYEFGMNDVVWVSPNVKLKQLDPDYTFILVKDMHKRLRDVTINQNDLSNPQTNYSLFYIYYNLIEGKDNIDLEGLLSFLKAEAKCLDDYVRR